MPLSIVKLQSLLEKKGFISTKFFALEGLCMYVEVICGNTGIKFLLYVPSKYEIPVGHGKGVYKVKYIELDMGEDSVADEYANSSGLEEDYANTMINLSPDDNEEMEEHLENNYKQIIPLKDISDEDKTVLRSLYRQLRRLRHCVVNIKYKVGIIFKNYLTVIRRDDSIDCLYIKHFNRRDIKKMYIVVDLETFYDKGEKMIEDINHVQDGIHRVMYRNQFVHSNIMGKMLENKKTIDTISTKTNEKRMKYEDQLQRLNRMLEILNVNEKKFLTELCELSERGTANIHTDVDVAHRKIYLEGELAKIVSLKEKIMRTMNEVRERRENTALSIDKIMFDNTVMFDCMIKNFAKLKEFVV